MSRTNKMLIDASHPEETRVVVVRDGRVEEFDFESASRKPLRGNIYLAKITRVEPSLQAAFVEYGGNRHGFLAFNEIHPDYYQIPMADRMALLEEEAAQEAAEEAEADAHAERLARRRNGRQVRGGGRNRQDGRGGSTSEDARADGDGDGFSQASARTSGGDYGSDSDDRNGDRDREGGGISEIGGEPLSHSAHDGEHRDTGPSLTRAAHAARDGDVIQEAVPTDSDGDGQSGHGDEPVLGGNEDSAGRHRDAAADDADSHDEDNGEDDGLTQLDSAAVEIDVIEPEGAEDVVEEVPQRPRRRMRSYKIQEVIKRRQVVLVQVVKEERGNKGAALTTYLSLAGRYTVLMPNTARGGGISRKITNPADRKRLKTAAQELDVPEGMGLIVRTAGAARTGQEIKRDFEYLLRLWESVRDLTLSSTAPTLVYEEGNLVKRSIRDLYNKDIEEIVVAGEDGYREAHDFMRMLTPSLAKSVIHYQGAEPLLARYRVEQQLAALFSPQVTLKSGGYIVINQTEALVAIDVNSGKSTREYSIEETALNTNLEASEEIARQVKLRDLAGLIVIDFIDMEEKRNNRSVERRLKDSLRNDRARIQLGRISHFGLMEMSRQRLRTGVVEGSTSQCPHCQGSGIVRSIESIALAVLRGIEDALMAGTRMALIAHTTPQVALYILNSKRGYIIDMEARHGLPITVQGSDKLQGANFTIEKVAAATEPTRRRVASPVNMEWGFDEQDDETVEDDAAVEIIDADNDEDEDAGGEERRADGQPSEDGRRRKRRRGRRGRRDEREAAPRDDYGTQPVGGYDGEIGRPGDNIEEVGGDLSAGDDEDDDDLPEAAGRERGAVADGDRESSEPRRRGRRRGRRGGRRSSGERGSSDGATEASANGNAHGTGQRDAVHQNGDGQGSAIAYLENGARAYPIEPKSGVIHIREPGPREPEFHEAGIRTDRGDRSESRAETEFAPGRASTSGGHDAPDRPHQSPTDGGMVAEYGVHDGVAAQPPVSEAIAAVPVREINPSEPPRQRRVVDDLIDVQPMAAPTTEGAAKPRRTSTSSEPVLERVVVVPGAALEAGTGDETETSKPRRGWWQRKLGLE